MKRIRVAWIEQIIEFDGLQELADYKESLVKKKKPHVIVDEHGLTLHIRLQYNNNAMTLEEGE